MTVLKQIVMDNVQEIVHHVSARKVECIVAAVLLAVAAVIGWLTTGIIDSGRNGIIRFYVGGTFSFFVMFMIYLYIDQLLSLKKA
ncbi:hypothetical protein [Geomicrobium sp. JCM 19039]|uniref:hypothetical protein n=1 Tax=Geomicrobium sp. JCM 19039 TaxID=1460636 RepID=UPI00045F4323|nr:hypothetical protein [Geomicrobium sp. JCM 19039]GAK13435.1 hypothetical protein JCM19039_3281 [Geomicrobium sp. JCM 19039]